MPIPAKVMDYGWWIMTTNDKPTPQYYNSINCKCKLTSLTLEPAKIGRHTRQHHC